MNLDTGKPVQVRIRADKSGPQPAPGTPWPAKGVEFPDGAPKVWAVSVNWVRNYLSASWLTAEGLRSVTRPSRPEPIADDSGSAAIAPEHYAAHPDLPPPHELLHADALVLQAADGGSLRYEVIRQPDKYVAGDTKGTKRVTPEVYAAGDTEVEHYFTVRLVEKG